MITEEEYAAAVAQKDAAQEIINAYHEEQRQAFDVRLATNTPFTDDELRYSATTLCPCGHGMAYPKGCTPGHYWDCSAILKGIEDRGVKHTDKLPFSMYDIKSENEYRGTTRGVFRPKPPESQ